MFDKNYKQTKQIIDQCLKWCIQSTVAIKMDVF